jgi:predicted DNA-binding transcriptional regulator YafY
MNGNIMRRADRLFQIIQILQRQRNVVTAAAIAEELEVSTRTIYRDIQDLMSNRVPIRGEAGTGYLLEDGYDVPPLMFDEEEIDAVMLGVQWVHANGDPDIRRAAHTILSKIQAVLPKDRQELMHRARQVVPTPIDVQDITVSMPLVRRAIREQVKLQTRYCSLVGEYSNRIICPLLIVFFQNTQLLVAWCELRKGYRNFRMDCFEEIQMLEARFSRQNFETLEAYLKSQRENGMP